jgi:uncharacterized protein (DUF1015 family)
MTTIRPFDGYLVNAERLQKVVSPAYDALTGAERHAFGMTHPQNYINAMRSQDEYPEDQQPIQEELLRSNAAHLQAMLDRGDFNRIERPSIFIYRLAAGEHRQTAVICEIPIDHYDQGEVLRHENTRSDKEDLLAGYLEVVGASSSPVCLAYHENSEIDRLTDSAAASPPLLDFSVHDDVQQTLWQVSDPSAIKAFARSFADVHRTYLTDGHHRFAAGSRFARNRRHENPDYVGEEHFNYVLVALFPSDQLRILPYNRCVKDLNGLTREAFLSALSESFLVASSNAVAAEPTRMHEFGMYLGDEWYTLTLKTDRGIEGDPVKALDVSVLQDFILSPILGIHDARSDTRLDYVTGDAGMSGLEQRCSSGWAVAFACYPTSIEQLMQIADLGEVMPPKSTYFDPKMRSGIFLRLY